MTDNLKRQQERLASTSPTKATLTISLTAIQNNYRLLSAKVKPAQCAAVIKANAYGLGIEHVAKALWDAGAREFFVAWLDEGITLRAALSEAKIYVLNGILPGDEALCMTHNLIPVLNDAVSVAPWKNTKLPVAIQVDTGLNRLGFNAADFERADFSGLNVELLFSHLACADTPSHKMNAEQRDRLLNAAKKLPDVRTSLAASDGIFCGADFYFDLVRPGAALYGINPTPGSKNPMQTVVTLSAPILQLRTVEQDGTAGYVATQSVKKGQCLATLGLGYADGVLRSLSSKGHVYYKDQALPILGRVSMDVVIVDISSLPENTLKVGDNLDVLNEFQTPDDLAKEAGTNGYEIMTALGNSPRLAKAYRS